VNTATTALIDIKRCSADTLAGGTTSGAPEAEDTKRCDEGKLAHATTSYACHVDDRPCEVVEPFVDQINGDLADVMEKTECDLPCMRCRNVERDAAALAGVRLGKHERRVLSLAPPWDGESKVIEPDCTGRSADEANRRAIRKLADVGLLWPGWQEAKIECRTRSWHGRTKRNYHKRAVWLTPLGEAVVGVLRQVIQNGKPIRWAKHVPALIAAARRKPDALLEEFLAELRNTKERRLELASLLGQMLPYHLNPEEARREIKEAYNEAMACEAVVKAVDT
jgi:hypothetical protein